MTKQTTLPMSANLTARKEIQPRVDRFLQEHGEYLPLEFLLQENRLTDQDYEDWRAGHLEYLEDVLFGDTTVIQDQLLAADHYVQQLGLQAVPVDYVTWSEPSRPLRISRNGTLSAILNKKFCKTQHSPQLDLFLDTTVTSLVNGALDALANRNPGEVRRQLERLYDTDPGHVRLGDLELLAEALEQVRAPVREVAAEMHLLQTYQAPLAIKLLGVKSKDLLAPLWQRLSVALSGLKFDGANPELHTSYTATQARDWRGVCRAVEQHLPWHTEPVLVQRHARACFQLRAGDAGLISWFYLCWLGTGLDGQESTEAGAAYLAYWRQFQELDPELDTEIFPSWLVLRQPAIGKRLPPPGELAGAPDHFHSAYALQIHHGSPQNPDALALRARLHQQAPALFAWYLKNRD